MSPLPQRLTETFSPSLSDDYLERRVSGQLRPPPRVERAVREAVAVEHGRGLVQAARARALHYVASESLQSVADLTELETLYLRRSPLGEARYRAIVDNAAIGFANIVADTARS